MKEELTALIWMGCLYRNKLEGLREDITKLLSRLEVDFETLRAEECCGYPLILIGYKKEARKFAENNIKKLKSEKHVVTPCPACYRAFKEFYPILLGRKLRFKVQHITQFYCDLIDKGVLRPAILKPLRMKVMYHNPCEMGRHSGIYEEPKRILKLFTGLDLHHPRFNHNLSACCGGGGLVSSYFPTLASMAAARKLVEEDRVPLDLEAIVTECPQCISNLQRAWVENESMSVELYNFSKLLNMALK